MPDQRSSRSRSSSASVLKEHTLAAATARARFIEVVKAAGGSRVVAQRLACSRSYVDMIRAGHRSPGMRVAHAIEREFGIPMKAWLDDAKRGA